MTPAFLCTGAASGSRKLFSFLGTGDYKATRYCSERPEPREVETCYVARAIAELEEVSEVVILATEKAEETHGDALRKALEQARLSHPRFVRLPDGKSADELWQSFAILQEELARPSSSPVLFDITHGFRAQPFFSAAAIAFLRALHRGPEDIRILYGAFEAKDSAGRTPIWDLTTFAELIDWTHAIGHFIRTGDARAAAERARRVGRELARSWAVDRVGAKPGVEDFATALESFSDALVTVRVGELLLARAKGEKPSKGPARVTALLDALASSREDLERFVPPLGEVFDELERMLVPLGVEGMHLRSPAAQRSVAALARLYWHLGRYAESAAVLREAWVNRYAADAVTRPGSPACTKEARKTAEERWWQSATDLAKEIADVRNDIEHAAFRSDPLPAKAIRSRLDRLVGLLEETVGDTASTGDKYGGPSVSGATYFVTRHPGAREWAREEGFMVDEVLDHLDVARIGAGDRVIGSLPTNLAAEVCARGGRYFHLSLDLTSELRGKELSAEEMRTCGARVEEFSVWHVR